MIIRLPAKDKKYLLLGEGQRVKGRKARGDRKIGQTLIKKFDSAENTRHKTASRKEHEKPVNNTTGDADYSSESPVV